jgi:cytochrome oxidase Cu insertion factor (SCO1/SenC/PrrC family)
MKLQEQLDTYKKGFIAKAPRAALETMHRATELLATSGLMERAVKVGGHAPDFTLEDTAGRRVSLSGLLGAGPVVLAFYRGKW